MKVILPALLLLSVVAATVSLAVVPASADEPIHVMPLGDSITAGYTDNPNWTVPFSFGYRSGLYTRMTGANYPFQFVGNSQEPWNGKFGVPTTVVAPDLRTVNQDGNRGYGGMTAAFLSANIGDWLGSDTPDVILLMIGINSIGQGSSGNPTAAENNLNSLVQNIVYERPTARLVVAQITPYASYTDSIVEYNNYIKNTLVPHYAAFGKNVTTVDQYSNFGSGTSVDASLYSNGINHPNAIGYDKMAATWYSGIQSLGSLPHSAGPARPALANGGFESTQYAGTSHNVNPGDATWNCTAGTAGAGSGIDQGNPYGVTNSTPANGTQMGFLQGAGAGYGTTSISQTLTGLIVGKTYSLSFQSKGIQGSGLTTDPFHVALDGTNLAFGGSTLVNPPIGNSYTTYSASFTASSTSQTLRFFDQGNQPYTADSFIDEVKLGIVTPTGSNLVANGTFEVTSFSNNTHNVNPSGTAWKYTTGSGSAGSGIDRGNPYGTANASAYEATQYAFLQGAGTAAGLTSLQQDVSGFQVGKSYMLTFESAAIEGASGANPFFVSIGGNSVTFGDGGAYVSPSSSYGLYTSTPFVATSATMALDFFDAGNVPTGFNSWIDDVQITSVPEPSTGLFLLALAVISGIAALAH